jgi:hypothetical protein
MNFREYLNLLMIEDQSILCETRKRCRCWAKNETGRGSWTIKVVLFGLLSERYDPFDW